MFASLRALLAALVMLPIGVLVLGSIPWRPAGLPLFATVLVLGCLAGSCLGMIMGTAVPPNRINVMFALVLTPLLFTGASQYPWASLDHLPWFQALTACNPLTYVSEGMRAAMVPEVPHIPPLVSVLVLVVTVGCRWPSASGCSSAGPSTESARRSARPGRAAAGVGRRSRLRVGCRGGQGPGGGRRTARSGGGHGGGAGVDGVLAVELDPAGAGVDEHGLVLLGLVADWRSRARPAWSGTRRPRPGPCR